MTHFREYIIVFAVAASVTWLATFPVRAIARRLALLVLPDDRRVHERPTPTGGGAAMFFGLLVAVAVMALFISAGRRPNVDALALAGG